MEVEQKTIGDWQVSAQIAGDELIICVQHDDNSPVIEVGADIGSVGELGYRLTTNAIESVHDIECDIDIEHIYESMFPATWKVELVRDSDNHLAIFINCSQMKEPTEVSVRQGSEAIPACEIVVLKGDS